MAEKAVRETKGDSCRSDTAAAFAESHSARPSPGEGNGRLAGRGGYVTADLN